MTDRDGASAPPTPPSSSSKRFWIAVALVILVMAGLGLAVSRLSAVGASLTSSDYEEEIVRGERDAADKVLDIALVGTISDVASTGSRSLVASIVAQLRQARKDEHVKAVLIEMNTPGGGITASDILYHEVMLFRKERKIPVVVLSNDLMASGGYYVAMAADHVMAHETSVVGSIGVIAQLVNVQQLMQKVGVQMNVVKSQRPDGSESFKDIGSPYREMKPAERALMQGMIQKMWGRFVDVVAEGRKGRLSRKQVEDLADGRVWTGREALGLSLIDSVGYQDDAFRKAAELAHVSNPSLVRYQRSTGWLSSLLGVHQTLPALGAWVEQSLDPAAASTPRLMYLWSVR